MKIGILITARLGSTRLERKHLLPVNDKPLLHYLIERIKREFSCDIDGNHLQLIIATSDESENRKFEDFARYGVSIFYGSLNNIPLRHSQAAKFNNLDAIVSVDGDDILCSTKGMREVYNALNQNIQYVKTINLPFGMNSWGYSSSFLASALQNHSGDTLETGWGRIFDEKELTEIKFRSSPQNESLRFTLDYGKDYQFFKALIEKIGNRIVDASDEEVMSVVLKEKIYKFNEKISKQYWENFKKLQKQEIEKSKIDEFVASKE